MRRLVAAVLLGAALGVGARVAMRLIALSAQQQPGASWGGSLEVVLSGTLAGAPIALLFLGLRGRLPPYQWWPGPVLGIVVFGFLAAWPPPSARSALAATAEPPLVSGLLFLGLLILFGVAMEWWWRKAG